MTIDFYTAAHSPPCHSVQMLITALGLDVTEIDGPLMPDALLNPDFVKVEYVCVSLERWFSSSTPSLLLQLNPQHTIPTIKDGDFVLWESRAILAYLANKYGKEDSLYPKDPVKRAIVDQRLHFDMGTLYQRFSDYYYPQILAQATPDPAKKQKLEEALEFLNTFLEGSKYVAGEELTIADFAVLASISTFVHGPNYNLEKYSNVQRWFNNAKVVVPGYEKTVAGMGTLKKYFEKINN